MRSSRRRASARVVAPLVQYPPGWFTEPARAWGVIAPSMLDMPADVLDQRRREFAAAQGRLTDEKTGKRWNGPCTVLPGSAKGLPPAPMAKPGTAPRRRGAAG